MILSCSSYAAGDTNLPAETDRTMTGLWLPAMKPKPWVGCRWMVTCRAEAGLRVPLSIPSWHSSNIAELQSSHTQIHIQTSALVWNAEASRVTWHDVYLSHAFECPSWTLAIPWEEGAAWDRVALQRLCSVSQSFTYPRKRRGQKDARTKIRYSPCSTVKILPDVFFCFKRQRVCS